VLGPIIATFFVEYISTMLWSNLLDYHLGALGPAWLIALYMPHGFMRFVRERSSSAAALLKPKT
jgi:hypothetical protein